MKKLHPEKIVTIAVKRMLPKNRMGRNLLTKLKVYKGETHPHSAQEPRPLKLAI
jgi:large subunit ribosomal protein L13